jgi:hypothetical protein
MNTTTSRLNTGNPPIVSRDRWLAQRRALLAREKEWSQLGDQIARERGVARHAGLWRGGVGRHAWTATLACVGMLLVMLPFTRPRA